MSMEQTPRRRRRKAVVENQDLPIENIEIDFIMVADWAETINGKLYIQGAGWDRLLRPPKENPVVGFAIAVGILVPWHLTNRQHQIELSIITGDGVPVGQAITGGFTVGRPAKALAGQKMRTPFAARLGAEIRDVGPYDIKFVVNNDITKVVTFYIVDQL